MAGTVEQAVAAFRHQADLTRELVRARVVQAWTRLGRVDDEAVDLFVAQVSELVQAGQIQVAGLTDAYLAGIASEVHGTPLEVYGVGAGFTYAALRNGTPAEVVYARPFITSRAALAKGSDLATALQVGAERLDGTVQADLQLAERRAAFEVVQADDRITGFRRVLRPALARTGSCGLCRSAASQTYSRMDLLPIHNRCHCTVMPIFGDRDEGVRLNAARYRELAVYGPGPRGGKNRSRLAAIREHGEMGPVLTKGTDRFTGPGAISA